MRALAALALLVVTAAVMLSAQTPAHPHLLMVVAKQQPGIAIYDADTDQLICKSQPMGVSPHEAEFSTDGRMAYVPVYGSSSVGAPGTDEHEIQFVRTSDCQTVAKMDTGEYKRPHNVAVGKSGLVYVTAELKESILVIDPQKREIIGTIPTGSTTTHMIALSADEKQMFTSNVMGKTLSVLDVPGRKLVKTIPTATNNQRMAISPDGKWFVTNLGQERKVAFYRTADGELDFSIELDGGPFVSKFSTDGKFLFVMGSGGGARGQAAAAPPAAGAAPAGIGGNLRAWKVDVGTRAVVATLAENLGSGAGSLAVNPFNGRVYFTAMAHDTMTVVDPATWTVAKQIKTEKNPDGLFFAAVK
jgi:YVTN family beta-propeller protein